MAFGQGVCELLHTPWPKEGRDVVQAIHKGEEVKAP